MVSFYYLLFEQIEAKHRFEFLFCFHSDATSVHHVSVSAHQSWLKSWIISLGHPTPIISTNISNKIETKKIQSARYQTRRSKSMKKEQTIDFVLSRFKRCKLYHFWIPRNAVSNFIRGRKMKKRKTKNTKMEWSTIAIIGDHFHYT